jgi:hypothetical protein
MSSNRLMYDRCAYATEIKESTEPLEYNLFLGKYENCKTCPVGNFPNVLPFGPRTNVESELWGITRPATDCPEKKFIANSDFKGKLPFSPPEMCQSIYGITPNNLVKPKTNMINNKNLGVNFCPVKNGGKESMKKTVEGFQDSCTISCNADCVADNWQLVVSCKEYCSCSCNCKHDDYMCQENCNANAILKS